jgi:hypothetical protein
MVPTNGAAEVHVPPVVASDKFVKLPAHKLAVPVIASGTGFTVTCWVTKQPVPKVYVIVGVPAATPVTIPPATVASPGLLLVHVPPPGAELSVVFAPTHILAVPVITPGRPLTVTVVVTVQPVGKVYVIKVVPPVRAETKPVVEPIVATPGVPLVHVPPVEASLSVVLPPAQTTKPPVIAAGNALTVICAVA